jgi:hypothetical protein
VYTKVSKEFAASIFEINVRRAESTPSPPVDLTVATFLAHFL